MRYSLLVLILGVILSGCATVYQRRGFTGGFSDTQLGENIFQVNFNGNGYTRSERASDFCLLRAADITLEKGFRYFIIVESGADSSYSTYTTPTTSHTTASAYGYGNYATGTARTTTYGGQTYRIARPSAKNTIICFNEKPEDKDLIFDAQFVSKSLREKYGISE